MPQLSGFEVLTTSSTEADAEIRRLARYFYSVESDDAPSSPRDVVSAVIQRLREYRTLAAAQLRLCDADVLRLIDVMAAAEPGAPCA